MKMQEALSRNNAADQKQNELYYLPTLFHCMDHKIRVA